MSNRPEITGLQLIRVLEKAGFIKVRQKGSHVQMRRIEADGRATTFPVPVHSGKTIKRGTLYGILRKAGIEPKDLKDLV